MLRRIARAINFRFGKPKDPEYTASGSRDEGTNKIERRATVSRGYSDLFSRDMEAFNAFAVQSRSLDVRDVYADVATNGAHDFRSLATFVAMFSADIDCAQTASEFKSMDSEVLSTLARLVLNNAMDTLDTSIGISLFWAILVSHGPKALTERDKLHFIEALSEVGKYDEQAELNDLLEIDSSFSLQVELLKVNSNLKRTSDVSKWVLDMNIIYSSLGLAQISILPDDSLTPLDRLTSNKLERVSGPLVSVIVPTFNPGPGLRTAIRSLLEQSWSNIEIIIVNDGSSTEFDALLHEIEGFSPKITLINQPGNYGAYVARNSGLASATGEFVTIHDDDDWSHPEKIAKQVSALEMHPSASATTTSHIRITEDLHFHRVNVRPVFLQVNYSSLMVRRALLEELQGWDTVNRGSDAELVSRIEHLRGKSAIVHIEDQPLGLSRVWTGSLTSGEMYRGYFAYSRLLYRWSFREWHRGLTDASEGSYPIEEGSRNYAVPTTFQPGARNKNLGSFDVIFVSDFAQHARFVGTVLHEIESCVSAGMRVGYLHINSPLTRRRHNIRRRLFDLQLAGAITQVSDSDIAETDLMVVHDGAIGIFLDAFHSSVKVRRGVIVIDEQATLKGAEMTRGFLSPYDILRNFDQAFSTEFQLVGSNPASHEQLQRMLPKNRVIDEVWRTHITDMPSRIRKPTEQVRLGFHSFGNKYRWPTTQSVFEKVYFSDGVTPTFFGITAPAAKKFSRDTLSRANILNRHDFTLERFLDEIDFWVYFPDAKLKDTVWSPVLSAMYAGKVVIMPERLRELYGSAAEYCPYGEVSDLITSYIEDPGMYVEKASEAQAFVSNHYDQASFIERIRRLQKL